MSTDAYYDEHNVCMGPEFEKLYYERIWDFFDTHSLLYSLHNTRIECRLRCADTRCYVTGQIEDLPGEDYAFVLDDVCVVETGDKTFIGTTEDFQHPTQLWEILKKTK